MEIYHKQTTAGTTAPTTAKVSPAARNTLLLLNCILLSVGNCGGPLIMRLYFLHGGKRVWLSSFLETAGWPFIIIALIILYFHRRLTGENKPTKLFYMRPRLFIAVAFIGIITGLDDYLYAYGVARLPVSTSALIIASQLGFTALFAYFLVKQKFTPYSINAVVLLTVGAGVLALHTNGDRPEGESMKLYVMGFVMTVAAALLYGFVLPLIELTYNKAQQEITYTLVLEIQMVMCVFATIFCAVGMIINNDFKNVSCNKFFLKCSLQKDIDTSNDRGRRLGTLKIRHVINTSAIARKTKSPAHKMTSNSKEEAFASVHPFLYAFDMCFN